MNLKPDNIPDRLKKYDHWICWKKVLNQKRKTYDKIPIDAKTGKAASSSDSSTWTDFNTAHKVFLNNKKYSGLMFAFTENDPFVGIDLDHVFDPKTGEIIPWALEVIKLLNSYTEISPSGDGFHIIVEGDIPESRCQKGGNEPHIEMYRAKRFFTFTGNLYE